MHNTIKDILTVLGLDYRDALFITLLWESVYQKLDKLDNYNIKNLFSKK